MSPPRWALPSTSQSRPPTLYAFLLRGLLRPHRIRGSAQEEQHALTSYHRRKLSAYDALLAAAVEDETRLARLAAGGIELDDETAMDEDDLG